MQIPWILGRDRRWWLNPGPSAHGLLDGAQSSGLCHFTFLLVIAASGVLWSRRAKMPFLERLHTNSWIPGESTMNMPEALRRQSVVCGYETAASSVPSSGILYGSDWHGANPSWQGGPVG